MSEIHGHAYATICALGPNDDYGLHGVSRTRDKNHFRGRDRASDTVIVKVVSPNTLRQKLHWRIKMEHTQLEISGGSLFSEVLILHAGGSFHDMHKMVY
jgi:hypothetical protein